MKKITALILSIIFCLTCAFALASCELAEVIENGDYTEEYSSDDKEGCVDLINGFFEETLKDPDFVVTNKTKDGTVQFTETVKGTSSHTSYEGYDLYAYKKGEFFYVATISTEENEDGEIQETRYYWCSDSSKPGYYEDNENGTMEDIYKGDYCLFMSKYGGVGIVSLLPEEDSTFHCVSKGERKDGKTTGSLEFDYTAESGSLKITADSKENLVQTIHIVINDNTDTTGSRDMTWTFVYGGASVDVPDTDAWDREEAEKEARYEANEAALDARDEFFDATYWEDNFVVTIETPTSKIVESLTEDVDCVDYGTYKTYAFYEDIDEDNWNTYYVFESEDTKYFMKNSDYFDDNTYVWYYLFIGTYDALEEDADFSCVVEGDTMTFTIARDGETLVTFIAEKTGELVTSATLTVATDSGDRTVSFTFEYGTADITIPDLTDFYDATPTEEIEE